MALRGGIVAPIDKERLETELGIRFHAFVCSKAILFFRNEQRDSARKRISEAITNASFLGNGLVKQ